MPAEVAIPSGVPAEVSIPSGVVECKYQSQSGVPNDTLLESSSIPEASPTQLKQAAEAAAEAKVAAEVPVEVAAEGAAEAEVASEVAAGVPGESDRIAEASTPPQPRRRKRKASITGEDASVAADSSTEKLRRPLKRQRRFLSEVCLPLSQDDLLSDDSVLGNLSAPFLVCLLYTSPSPRDS